MFERHIHDLLALVPRDRETVDLQDLFYRLTVDSGTELLFGTSCDSLREYDNYDANSSFAKALDAAQGEMIIRDILGPSCRCSSRRKNSGPVSRLCMTL
jgi:hypothetical protein